MQYIAINLVASLLFLIGLAMIYGTAGTLNMADLAGRIAQLGSDESQLLLIGIAVLAIAFLTKSAMWPLGFWLPTTYSAASPPVAAMFVLMTKVGIYAILRLWILVYGDEQSHLFGFGSQLLFWIGIVTIATGAFGMLASDRHGRLAAYAAIVSSGTLLALIGLNDAAVLSVAVFYLVASTLAMAAFLLLSELVERNYNPVEALLSVTREAFDFEEAPDQPVGVTIPASFALLSLSFAVCVILITGLPPLTGFVAKLGMLNLLLSGAHGLEGALLAATLLAAGLSAIIALMRFGI